MSKFIPNTKRFLKRNSSTILTCIGAAGVIATAVMSARDTIKAKKIIEEMKETDEKLTKKEIVSAVAPAYIPTVAVGLSTLACIFGANALNKKTQASLMSAYAILNQSYNEYRGKAKELYGEDSDRKIREAIAVNHYDDSDAFEREEGKQLFFDFYGLQMFNATMEEVLKAEKAVKQLLDNNGYVGLNTFYQLLGIKCTDVDYEIGWSRQSCKEYGCDGIEFYHEESRGSDGIPFTSITMVTPPVEDYMWF